MRELLTWPFLMVMVYWPYAAIAQVASLVAGFTVYLLWPKYPKWLTRWFVLLIPTLLLALMLTLAIIELTFGYVPMGIVRYT
jgi:hypothetical protein